MVSLESEQIQVTETLNLILMKSSNTCRGGERYFFFLFFFKYTHGTTFFLFFPFLFPSTYAIERKEVYIDWLEERKKGLFGGHLRLF